MLPSCPRSPIPATEKNHIQFYTNHAFYTRMKKNGHISASAPHHGLCVGGDGTDGAILRRLILAARRRCAGRDCLFAASFGSRCSAQAWKKESLALGQLLQPLCVHLTRNIWLDCDRRAETSDLRPGGARPLRLSDFILKDGIGVAATSLSQPVLHRDDEPKVNRKGLTRRENRC